MGLRKEYIDKLEDFKSLLESWRIFSKPENRTKINKNIRLVKDLIIKTGSFKEVTLEPRSGGIVHQYKNPFDYIFSNQYQDSARQAIFDMIDESIGVIEMHPKFTLTSRQSVDIDNQNQSIGKDVSNRVFLVHGHDNELKESTARFLERIDLEPVILHEQTNKGRTIIEKFEEYSDVAFAVVQLTPDDFGKRARQNVIFEMGYFIGKLGRQNVVGLIKGNVEIPSDYSGVMYINVDEAGSWKYELAKEIKAAGLVIEISKIV